MALKKSAASQASRATPIPEVADTEETVEGSNTPIAEEETDIAGTQDPAPADNEEIGTPATELSTMEKAALELEVLQILRERLGIIPQKHSQSHESGSPPAKKTDIRIRPPTKSERYSTKDYTTYRAFITSQESTADANEPQLGDPRNRKQEAWSRMVYMKPRDGETDYAYWQRWREQRAEIGDDSRDLAKVWLHLFFESFPRALKNKVRELPEFPKTEEELVSLLARLRPNLESNTHRDPSRRNHRNHHGSGGSVKRPEDRVFSDKGEKAETTVTANSKEGKKKEFKKFNPDVKCYNCGKTGHIASIVAEEHRGGPILSHPSLFLQAWVARDGMTPALQSLVDSGSSINIVPATLAKEAGWKLLPRQVFARTLTSQEVRNEGVVKMEVTLADSDGKEQRFRELAVASPDVNYIVLGIPWLKRHDPATLWAQEKVILRDDPPIDIGVMTMEELAEDQEAMLAPDEVANEAVGTAAEYRDALEVAVVDTAGHRDTRGQGVARRPEEATKRVVASSTTTPREASTVAITRSAAEQKVEYARAIILNGTTAVPEALAQGEAIREGCAEEGPYRRDPSAEIRAVVPRILRADEFAKNILAGLEDPAKFQPWNRCAKDQLSRWKLREGFSTGGNACISLTSMG
ncbi:uncharacterized protein CDV56_100670 [Aspergillus thermomutatus]|uniref:CCHC-type domain-containing protein n=1 Tax=Aspergillus thermomutatus TaxID=41047 RepID=A0A397G0S1_ASPTH|nr:uncharacterized protein CDV56_100670 [Aspergillus thermomutatus]RHZ43158.1 hypothetical protein CDV56_100670 [Aspergillus thermomutatus]